MTPDTRGTLLRVVLLGTAAFLILLLPFMFDLWPAGFRWSHPAAHPAYERMIVAVYFALGVCLIPTALDPERHVMLIDFTILSSLLHGAAMAYDSFAQEHEMTHLVGDVPSSSGFIRGGSAGVPPCGPHTWSPGAPPDLTSIATCRG
jgi:hypothetical protein